MAIKQRILEYIQDKGFLFEESVKIYDYYMKNKLIKISYNEWSFIHGIFSEYSVMVNVLIQ